MLINEVLKEFIFDCEIRKISSRTLKGYRNNNQRFFNYIEQEFNITELEEFSHLHIKKYFRFLIDKGLTETYANGILKCMREFFVYCVKEEYVSKNPYMLTQSGYFYNTVDELQLATALGEKAQIL